MVGYQWITSRKDVAGGDCGLVWGTVPAFAWKYGWTQWGT